MNSGPMKQAHTGLSAKDKRYPSHRWARINVYRFDPPIHSTRDDLPGRSRFEHSDETWCPLHVRDLNVRHGEAVLHQESDVHHGPSSVDAVRIVAGRIS